MKKKELENLAHKVQLEIKETELADHLKTFSHLEKMLKNFKKIKIEVETSPVKRKNADYLTLQDLEKLTEKYSSPRISKKILKNNATVTPDGFILFKPKKQ